MTDPTPTRDEAVEAVATAFKRMHSDTCYPSASDGEAKWAAEEIIKAYKAAVDRVNRATDTEIGGIHRSLASAPAPASGRVDGVDWKALFEAAHGALICIGQMQGDAEYARTTADALTVASLSPAATPVSEADRKETHQLDSGLSCEFDGDCYTLTWPDGHWLVAKADGSVIAGRSPSSEWHQPACKSSVAALAKPASSPAGGQVRAAMDDLCRALDQLISYCKPVSEDHVQRVSKCIDFIRSLSQSTSAGRVGE